MPFHYLEGVKYYTFDGFDAWNLPHAVFTRQGGVSPSPWKSLNFGGTVGDEPQRVSENHTKALRLFQLSRNEIFDVWQVHGVEVCIAKKPREMLEAHQKADIVLTRTPHLYLMMRFADCVPILLFDPVTRSIGLIHAGWQGTVKGAATQAVEQMRQQFGANPANILAAIGPSIGPDHYQIGADVISLVEQAFNSQSHLVLQPGNGAIHFDLWAANELLLRKAGVEQVENAGLCTACHLEDWYSHRAERGKTGRFGVLMGLPEG
jgi:YfiH family protein